MGIMHKICHIMITGGLLLGLFFMSSSQSAFAFGSGDAAAIGAAYMTHLSLHEIGHQVVAEEVGADSPKMSFLLARTEDYIRVCPPTKTSPRNRNCPMQLEVIGWQGSHLNMPCSLIVTNQPHTIRP